MSDNTVPRPATRVRPSLSTVWRELRELIRPHHRRLAIGLLLLLVSRAAGLVLPASSKYVIDHVVVARSFDMLGWLAALVALATMVQVVAGYALNESLGVAAERLMAELRCRVHAHVLRLPVAAIDATKVGALSSRVMTDASGIPQLIGTGAVQLVGGLLTSATSLAVLVWIDWRTTMAMLAVIVLFGIALFRVFAYLRPTFVARSHLTAVAHGRVTETLGGLRVVKTYAMEAREEAAFAESMEALVANGRRGITGWSIVAGLVALCIGAVGVVLILMGGTAYADGRVTLGDLGMYVLFTGMATAPLIQVTQVGTKLTEAVAGLDRIRALLALPTEDATEHERQPVPPLRGEVRFDGVDFSYVPGSPVLQDITFEAAAGTTTALVGPSGAGKSTLLGLLTAFEQPERGRVMIDGLDLATLRRREYRRHLGVVFQETFLFDASIIDNIHYARPEAADKAVLAAARAARCDEFATRLPNGWDTVVGERGVRLSGGQRQRLAIARALLADPAILLLDEATASLDSESEAQIRDALRELRRGRTAFVIAHRLSTIMSADQILVLDGGRIVERGTHASLLTLGGTYHRLFEQQHRVLGDRFVNPGEVVPVGTT
jgi:ABC-type multidrug transport system fused ATPase/permease subunit